MTRVTLYILLSFCSLSAFSQKVYFVYLQTENDQPFYLRMDKATYSSSASGYLIVSKLKDSTYSFTLGFPQAKWPEQRFSVALNKKDHGYLVKNFGDKGWGLFDFQTLSVQMAGSGTAKVNADGKDDSPFTDILAKASDDPSLKEFPITPPVEKGPQTAVAEKTKDALTETKSKEIDKKVNDSEKKEDKLLVTEKSLPQKEKTVTPDVSKPEIKKTEEVIQPIVKAEEKKEPVISKEDPIVVKKDEPQIINATYKPTTVVKKSESATKDGVGLVFVDQSENGNSDTIALIIPETKPLVPVQETPVKEEKKFVEILPDATGEDLIIMPGQKFYHEMNNCGALAKDNDFFKLRKQMAAVDGDDMMIAEAVSVFNEKCFTTQQIKNLGSLFLSDEGKLRFFVAGYYHVSDKNNYGTLQPELKEQKYISQFKAMLAR
jgi:hypothetical protein